MQNEIRTTGRGRFTALLALFIVFALGMAAAQVRTAGRILGTVTDPTAAIVIGADVELSSAELGITKRTTTGSDGRFVFLDVPNGDYRITISMPGFQTVVLSQVKVDLGRSTEVSAVMQVGQVEAQVVVEGAATVLQTQATSIEGVIHNRVLRSLPLNNRDVLDFALSLPGANFAGTGRGSTIAGLPKGNINISMDGVNIQDNISKSGFGGGFFPIVRPRLDNVEEVQVTTGVAGADASDGAVQVKFVTRRGTNDWHGGVFWYYRDQGLNANSYFNNRVGLPRTKNHLNQYGINMGGPLIKDRLFVFGSWEDFRLPEARQRETLILTPAASAGLFSWASGGGGSIDVLAHAAGNGFVGTIDPIVQKSLDAALAARGVGGVSSFDLFRDRLRWDADGTQRRWFGAARVDYHITDTIRWRAIGHWNHFGNINDTLNNMDPPFPGLTGALHTGAGQNSRRWMASTGFNWAIRPNLTYEARLGRTASLVGFFPEATTASFFPDGIAHTFPLSIQNLHVRPPSGNARRFLGSNRVYPVTNMGHTVGWVKGKHTFNFGSTMAIFTGWQENWGLFGGGIPTVPLGVHANDAAAAIFNTTSMPGASTTDLSNARNLYALLAGRIAGPVSGTVNLNTFTKQFEDGIMLTTRERQNAFGFFVTDSWRMFRTFTVNLGLRWDYQGAPYDLTGTYLSPDFSHAFGKSGPGNMYSPGTMTGPAEPLLTQRSRGLWDRNLRNFAPSIGFAWSPHTDNSAWNTLFGRQGQTVFRGGYSINYSREGLSHLGAWAGSSVGLLQSLTATIGEPGFDPGSLLRDPIPLNVTPAAYSTTVALSDFTFRGGSFNTIDPNLRIPYVQSWSFGLQRELDRNTVIEARYVGNRGTRLWRAMNVNEVNIFESGFLNEFRLAQENLALNIAGGCGNRFDPQPGCSTNALPILTEAFGARGLQPALADAASWSSGTFINWLNQGQAGVFANSIAQTLATACRLYGNALARCDGLGYDAASPFPANLLIANPDAAGLTNQMLVNGAYSNYNSLQIEVRRRMAQGLQMNSHYTFSKNLSDMYGDFASSTALFTFQRNPRIDRGLSAFDVRHAFRSMFVYELPFGAGRRWASGSGAANAVIGGWEVMGVIPIQSGRPIKLSSGRGTVTTADSGVLLGSGVTPNSLRDMFGTVTKIADITGCNTAGTVLYLDPRLIDPARGCRSNTAFVGPFETPGDFGRYVYNRGPRFVKPDISVAKKTRITERVNSEFRAEFFNAFNYQNFVVGGPAISGGGPTVSVEATNFGQTATIVNDLGSQDQGPRMVQFVFRVNW